MFKYGGLWNRICKFFGFKSDSEGYTKENTEGKDNGVSRTVFDQIKDGKFPSLTGITLTMQDADKIKKLLHTNSNRKIAESYFENVVATRVK